MVAELFWLPTLELLTLLDVLLLLLGKNGLLATLPPPVALLVTLPVTLCALLCVPLFSLLLLLTLMLATPSNSPAIFSPLRVLLPLLESSLAVGWLEAVLLEMDPPVSRSGGGEWPSRSAMLPLGLLMSFMRLRGAM